MLVGPCAGTAQEAWLLQQVPALTSLGLVLGGLCAPQDLATLRLWRRLGLEHWLLPMPAEPPWSSIRTLAYLARRWGAHLLHAHQPEAHLLAGFAARLTHLPVLSTLHALHLSPLDEVAHRLAASHFSVACQQTHQHLQARRIAPQRISLDPHGIDVLRLPACPAAGAVIAVGLHPAERDDDARLLQQVLNRLNGPGRGRHPIAVRCRPATAHGGYHAVRDWLCGASLLLSHDSRQAVPVGLLEALACGVPVVAGAQGLARDVVEHGLTGWLCAPGDAAGLASRCAQVLQSPNLRKAMSVRCRARARAQLDCCACQERLAATLRRVAGGPGLGPCDSLRA